MSSRLNKLFPGGSVRIIAAVALAASFLGACTTLRLGEEPEPQVFSASQEQLREALSVLDELDWPQASRDGAGVRAVASMLLSGRKSGEPSAQDRVEAAASAYVNDLQDDGDSLGDIRARVDELARSSVVAARQATASGLAIAAEPSAVFRDDVQQLENAIVTLRAQRDMYETVVAYLDLLDAPGEEGASGAWIAQFEAAARDAGAAADAVMAAGRARFGDASEPPSD